MNEQPNEIPADRLAAHLKDKNLPRDCPDCGSLNPLARGDVRMIINEVWPNIGKQHHGGHALISGTGLHSLL